METTSKLKSISHITKSPREWRLNEGVDKKNDKTKRRKDSAFKKESDMKSLMEDSKNKTNKQKRSQLDWNRRLSRVKTKI